MCVGRRREKTNKQTSTKSNNYSQLQQWHSRTCHNPLQCTKMTLMPRFLLQVTCGTAHKTALLLSHKCTKCPQQNREKENHDTRKKKTQYPYGMSREQRGTNLKSL
ncbi:hypothetical protein, unlikely [Trypanosoma brucei gambiense DAL972]|uniref:Uncharacterized protein n=1 Tax=Trypanosoma brucei gambiense (strain MHOM/CI/86/DAL972) TaxID=679716 RepID=D0A579_TRYB9|nr:hypothetical protein, unlikely [Trypanosoma brucei gambiense DAL972]CBH16423.1 hypothetical protein, unlikely [Trypanosoma brucei gambiense DAL972]|eukprot:XP_011778687.1 hypothetical protein, unlikely [Trypanosoma brucei gambiense DAL972]